MWDSTSLLAVFGGLSLVSALLGMITRGLWKLARDISDLEAALRKDIGAARTEIDMRVDTLSLRLGETTGAIREHVNQEISRLRKELTDDQKFGLHTFARRDDATRDQDAIRTELRLLEAQMGKHFDRLESKIDRRNHSDGDKKPGTS